jgi:DNA-directed RNA polymerase specialized sigma24 family protein
MTMSWHGVALDAIDRAARHAANACWSRALDAEERVATAYVGIANYLASTDEHPYHHRLVAAGVDAVDAAALSEIRAAGATAPVRRATYWLGRNVGESFDEVVTDRLAVEQVLGGLRPADADAIRALAIGGTLAEAAELLGVVYGTAQRRVAIARRAALDLWGDGEAIAMRRDRRVESYSRPPATHGKCGHELSPENTYRTQRTCRVCAIQR